MLKNKWEKGMKSGQQIWTDEQKIKYQWPTSILQIIEHSKIVYCCNPLKNTRNQEALYINTFNSRGSCLKETVQEEKVIHKDIFNAALLNGGKNSRTITIPHYRNA